MKKICFLLILLLTASGLLSQTVEQVYHFTDPAITATGEYSVIAFPGTRPTALPGDPMLPYQSVALLLPPGQEASSIDIIGEDETIIPGTYLLYPQQHVTPLSVGGNGEFVRNNNRYSSSDAYPEYRGGTLLTEYMNGFGFALCSFTPVTYYPALGTVTYFGKITVRITCSPSSQAAAALQNLNTSGLTLQKLASLAQNRDAIRNYPEKHSLKSAGDMIIITPQAYETGFQTLVDRYVNSGTGCQVMTTEAIAASVSGQDLQEKIRNFIIQEYQGNGTSFFLLGGDSDLLPFRGFYCQVQSSSLYEDYNIPADLYYSALDGNWNTNANGLWGEPEEDDLLPEVAVARFPFSNAQELTNMIHKSVSYQDSPIPGDVARPFMVGEHMYDNPLTFGSDYLELLIGDHNDNGYFTFGIPEENNDIIRLYDTLISLPTNYFYWNVPTMLNLINAGRSIIHHAGHSNVNYMMRLFNDDITNANFSNVNGIDHNFQIMYSHGCLCGAFDDDCIAERSVTIANFLVAGVFNSRYGWFNEGQTEGPSAHLHREFISALYNPTMPVPQIGETHRQSKIMTAPWVTAPGQYEPGALRWCFYCSNVFGDPCMTIWTDDSSMTIPEALVSSASLSFYPNPANEEVFIHGNFPSTGIAEVTLRNMLGQSVFQQKLPVEKDHTIRLFLDAAPVMSGIYLVNVAINNVPFNGKLIVRK